MKYQTYGKRLFDLSLCLATAPLVLPAIAAVALVSWVSRQDRVFFWHQRPGRGGQGFNFYKMATLRNAAVDAQGKLLNEGQRQTRWGKFLRDYSLDELPQWFNILKGDMSWVGPRPLLTEYLPYYTARQNQRHRVKPGLTGLAQINGRNQLSWQRKLAYDWLYVQHISFKLDMYILAGTLWQLGTRQKVNFGQRRLTGPPPQKVIGL